MRQSVLPSLGFAILAGVLAVNCGGGGGYGMSSAPSTPTAAAPPDAGTMVVGVIGNNGASSFSPNPASAKVGQKVAWKNNDGIVHHIVEDTEANNNDGYGYGPGNGSSSGSGFDGGVTAPGATSGTMTLGNAGTMRYHCTIHPGMVGSIVVQ
jgi:plastocyanin